MVRGEPSERTRRRLRPDGGGSARRGRRGPRRARRDRRHVPLATEGSGGWHLDRLRDATTEPRPLDHGGAGRRAVSTAATAPGDSVLAVMAQTVVIVFGALALLVVGRALLRMARRIPEPPDLAAGEHWPEPAAGDGRGRRRGPRRARQRTRRRGHHRVLGAARGGRGGGRRGPRRAETSAELASRVLDDLHAPEDAVDELLQRYRRARYSHHPLDEHDRAVAVRALRGDPRRPRRSGTREAHDRRRPSSSPSRSPRRR